MAASSKFDLSTGSPEGPTYLNGQRGPYTAALLDRSGSFRDLAENRTTSSFPSMSRSGSTSSQADMFNLFQSLLSDLKAVALDQKFPRPGELKRSILSILGISLEDSLPATFSAKPLPSSSVEELKRVKSNLHESFIKARDRAKAFGEAASKIEKYCPNLSRKRSRADISSSERSNALLPGGSIPKTGPQSHQTASSFELGPQKSEEKAKSTVPNRRIRTSMVDVRMDARTNGITRPSGSMDRDRDVVKLVNGGAAPSEEKGRALSTGDGWEKNMKKKRSVIKSDVSASAVLARPLDGDREPKRGLQQKHGSDARPRLNNTHGFRSGPIGALGVGKLDPTSHQNGHGMRPLPRNPQGNGSLPNDKRDRSVGSENGSATLKAANKANGREDNCAASPTSVVKVNAAARAPRSNSGSLSKASPNIHRAMGNPDDWEHPQCINKLKRSTMTRSSSPPVTQWVGQRPQKIPRVARRSNLPPLVSSHDETPTLDTVDNTTINNDELGFAGRLSSNTSQQVKLKGEHVPSVGLTESEESGVPENKSKDKIKKCCDIEEKGGQTVQKISTLVFPSRKSKVAADEDLGDGVRRQGRIGRGFTPTRSGMPAAVDKLDDTASAKLLRSARLGYEKIESKPGRPSTKKLSERKGYARPRHSVNNASSEFAEESDDDHKELLAAAKAALNTGRACSSSFWEQIEPVFGFLAAGDIAYLNQQIHVMDVSAASIRVAGDDGQNSKGDLEYGSLPSTPALASRDDCGTGTYGVCLNGYETNVEVELAHQSKPGEPFLEQLVQESGAHNGVSICQALLSAIIGEEEIEKYYYSTSKGEEYYHDDAYGIQFEIDAEMDSKASILQSSERALSNGYMVNSSWRCHDGLANDKLENNDVLAESNIGAISGYGHALDELLLERTLIYRTVFTEFQYNEMSINDRILLELSEIGLYAEPVPDLAQSEDEDICEGINRLEEKLHEQVAKKKCLLLKLEKAVMEAGERQIRELERISLNINVGMAYEKYMACWGPTASGSKNVNKITKHATLAFVKRTLARYRKFEETGNSCFSEPAFRDMFLSVSSHNSNAECIDVVGDGDTANLYAPVQHSEITLTDHSHCQTSKPGQIEDIPDKYSSDAFRSVSHLSEETFGKEDPWSNRVRKRELLLDDVVGSAVGAALKAPSSLGSSLVSGTKGKRSERDRDGKGHNRDTASRSGTAKIGRPALSNAKGERKNKTKPKQKTTQLSASFNGLHSKVTEIPNTNLSSVPKSCAMVVGRNMKEKDDSSAVPNCLGKQDTSNDAETIDLSNLQLPEIDVGDFEGQGQDIGSWLNIDVDGLQDHDFMGLEIPMDDLSDVNMML